jgi:hypothetical protein
MTAPLSRDGLSIRDHQSRDASCDNDDNGDGDDDDDDDDDDRTGVYDD